jgi:hypothetical protein
MMTPYKNAELDLLLHDIEKLLKDLICNATELKKTSEHKVTQKEISPLQKKEAMLIKKISEADKKLSKESLDDVKWFNSKQLQQIDRMLQEFQFLNQEFFKNIALQENIIYFKISKQQQDLLKNPE